MKNYMLALGATVLAFVFCVLVIHYEARQTWKSMQELAHEELPKLVQEGLDTMQTVGDKLPKPKETTPDGEKAGSSPSVPDPGEVLGKVRDALQLPSGIPLPKMPAKPADAIDAVFGTAQDVVNSTEKSMTPYVRLSISEERALGRQYYEQEIRENVIIKDSALYDRIDELAAPILRSRRRRGIDYTFTVVKSHPDDINAYSMIGGYIFLHSAAINFFKTDAALQSVIGHEMGHVDLGHCAQSVGVAQNVMSVGGSFAKGMHAMLARPYSQVQEYEADEYGFRAQIAAGRTREQALEGPRQFARYFRLRGENQPMKKKSDHSAVGTLIEDYNSYFRTHPYEDARVKRLEAIQIDSDPAK